MDVQTNLYLGSKKSYFGKGFNHSWRNQFIKLNVEVERLLCEFILINNMVFFHTYWLCC